MLAEPARRAGLFIAESHLDVSGRSMVIRPGSVFLVRKGPDQWAHAGVVVENPGDCFVSIEGNDEDNRDGHEVCRRMRGFSDKDFIVFDWGLRRRNRPSQSAAPSRTLACEILSMNDSTRAGTAGSP